MNRKSFFMSLAALVIFPKEIVLGIGEPKLTELGAIRPHRVVVYRHVYGEWHHIAESNPIYVEIDDKLSV